VPGVRIHHPTLTSCTLLVPHPGDPSTGRQPKDYHLRLDGHGDAIVSETVWRRLVEARTSGLSAHDFLVLNEVPDPPAQSVGDVQAEIRRTYRQVNSALAEVTPPGARANISRHVITRKRPADG
jgi:hypothetical protein